MTVSTGDKSKFFAELCALLEQGLSLRKACLQLGVTQPTVSRWINEDKAFAEQYARAKDIGLELMAEEILQISDDKSGDIIETENGPKQDTEFVARSRLRVDSRKWLLSKMLPKKYGERLDITAEVTVKAAQELDALNKSAGSNS